MEMPMTKATLKKLGIPAGAALVSPGEILKEEFMEPLKLSVRELARRMDVGPIRVSQVVRGQRSITAETALRLGMALGTTALFWMNLQINHDLAVAAKKVA